MQISYDKPMNQETRYSLERYFDCRIKVRKATAHERAETSVSVSSDTGSLFVPPTLTASEYSVYWSFNNRLDMENKSSKEISHLLFCSRLLTEQEEIRIEHWKNHYFSQVIEVIANESEKGIVLLQKGNILHYENPTARKWHLSEGFSITAPNRRTKILRPPKAIPYCWAGHPPSNSGSIIFTGKIHLSAG